MSNVLFLGVPSHGHINPTIGLVRELVARGETVTYFASPQFEERLEKAGAHVKFYMEDLDMFKARVDGETPPMYRIVGHAKPIVADILEQIEGLRFDYIIHSAAFPFAKPIAQILKLPTVSSLAVFAGLEPFLGKDGASHGFFSKHPELGPIYQNAAAEVTEAYGVAMPESLVGLLMNVGDLNLVYTSTYFASYLDYFDDTFKFVGPPVSDRQETTDFPFEKLEGKKVLYISLGTVFSRYNVDLYRVFFEAFADWEGVVVMAAYNVDRSAFEIPESFIVQNYVPQHELLKLTTVAITHAGMNSMNDLISAEVPFVSLPMGADQPDMAARAQHLGATIVLDFKTVTPEELKAAVDQVETEGHFRANLQTINGSFKTAGGYPKAVDEIFALKRERNLS